MQELGHSSHVNNLLHGLARKSCWMERGILATQWYLPQVPGMNCRRGDEAYVRVHYCIPYMVTSSLLPVAASFAVIGTPPLRRTEFPI
jgi:hypothetical protein